MDLVPARHHRSAPGKTGLRTICFRCLRVAAWEPDAWIAVRVTFRVEYNILLSDVLCSVIEGREMMICLSRAESWEGQS